MSIFNRLALVLIACLIVSCVRADGIGGGIGGANGIGNGVGDPSGISSEKISLAPNTPCGAGQTDFSVATGCNLVWAGH